MPPKPFSPREERDDEPGKGRAAALGDTTIGQDRHTDPVRGERITHRDPYREERASLSVRARILRGRWLAALLTALISTGILLYGTELDLFSGLPFLLAVLAVPFGAVAVFYSTAREFVDLRARSYNLTKEVPDDLYFSFWSNTKLTVALGVGLAGATVLAGLSVLDEPRGSETGRKEMVQALHSKPSNDLPLRIERPPDWTNASLVVSATPLAAVRAAQVPIEAEAISATGWNLDEVAELAEEHAHDWIRDNVDFHAMLQGEPLPRSRCREHAYGYCVRRVAEVTDGTSLEHLAREGDGDDSVVEVRALLRDACAAGNPRACWSMAQITAPESRESRREWLTFAARGCQGGLGPACREVGWRLRLGTRDMNADPTAAQAFLLRAHLLGDGQGSHHLGLLYWNGAPEVERRRALAIQLLRQSCAADIAEACNDLGFTLRWRPHQDLEASVRAYARACILGHFVGCAHVEQLLEGRSALRQVLSADVLRAIETQNQGPG